MSIQILQSNSIVASSSSTTSSSVPAINQKLIVLHEKNIRNNKLQCLNGVNNSVKNVDITMIKTSLSSLLSDYDVLLIDMRKPDLQDFYIKNISYISSNSNIKVIYVGKGKKQNFTEEKVRAKKLSLKCSAVMMKLPKEAKSYADYLSQLGDYVHVEELVDVSRFERAINWIEKYIC